MPVVLFAHLTWKTFRNMPMLGRSEARFLERFLPAEVQWHGAVTLALGMVSDHVHIVVRLPARFDLPRMVQGLKGASARLINKEQRLSTTGVRWATGYSAYSVSRGDLKAAIQYAHDQPSRHPDRAIPQE
jgi:REP element-mobilizing transposase RayT